MRDKENNLLVLFKTFFAVKKQEKNNDKEEN